MSEQIKRKRKNKTTTLYSVLSNILVLYMLGLFTFVFLNANSLSNHFKENLEVNIVLNDNIKDNETLELQNYLANSTFTKSIAYTSKNEAKAIFESAFNEKFDEVLGFNPLFASLDLKLNAKYANKDSIELIKSNIENKSYVNEVYYQKNLVQLVNNKLKMIGYIILIISVLFLLITITLIDNTIKISMYSQRFLIRSMQLVGATKQFITKPFIQQSVNNGIMAAVFSVFGLTITLVYLQQLLPTLYMLKDLYIYIMVVILIFAIGIFFSWWSTKRSVSKYIKMKLDELY